MRNRRLCLLVPAVVGLIAIAGCAPSEPTPTPTITPTTAEVPSEDTYDRGSAPTEAPPAGDTFGFDEAARYDNRVLVQIDSVEAGTATETMTGAEGTGGEIVTVTVELINEGTDTVDLADWAVHAYYGDADVGAVMVRDEAGTVGDSFDGSIGPSQSVTADFAFAAPAAEIERVSVLVDPRDDVNEPVLFVGAADS
ncbi:hypothetical protein [Naumannella halotolerans]|uniref:DUF4352 domain-containing protein n=1 Tax=Naumannella halotolerans TaxID=993414 RepID=A0A4R7J3L2_9ACTN|nr:hypothetical protein [Naumannella halotolerans]TDT30987.1 hypothetical protein CLV29_2396 [Naumannella halotolerans]